MLRSALKGQQKLAWASDGEVEGHDLGLFECDEVFTAPIISYGKSDETKGEELRGMSGDPWLWRERSGKCSWMAT